MTVSVLGVGSQIAPVVHRATGGGAQGGRSWFSCVSRAQARELSDLEHLIATIENGVEVHRTANKHRRRFAAGLGRICPEKNFHAALDAAAAAHTPMLLAGRVFAYPDHEAYFGSMIRPRLDGVRRFIGEVGPRKKTALLSRARCLLAPSLAPETSSLVAMEAICCGTPVIGYRSRALAEIVE